MCVGVLARVWVWRVIWAYFFIATPIFITAQTSTETEFLGVVLVDGDSRVCSGAPGAFSRIGDSQVPKVSPSESFTPSFTVCAFVRVHKNPPVASLFSINTPTAAFLLEVSRLGVGLQVKRSGSVVEEYFFEARLSPGSWRHLCLAYNNHSQQALCSIDGSEEPISGISLLSWGATWQPQHKAGKDKASGESKLDISEKLKCLSGAATKCEFNALMKYPAYVEIMQGRQRKRRALNVPSSSEWVVCVGRDGAGSLQGEVAGMGIWKGESNLEDMHRSSGCLLYPSTVPPDIRLTLGWQVTGNTTLKLYKLGDVCKKVTVMLVQSPGTHTQHERLCGILGGTIPQANFFTSSILQMAQGAENICVGPDGLLTWITAKARLGNISGTGDECPGISVNGRVWIFCEVRPPCGVCAVNLGISYSLYGHNGRLFDHTFYLDITETGYSTFKGVAGSEIVKERNTWILISKLHQHQWVLLGNVMPVGRRLWITGKEGNTTEQLLTLTTCRTTQFSCDDGECISQTARCDDILNCRDHSDEANCLVVELAEGYDPNNLPPLRPGESTPIPLPYHINVYNVGDVTTRGGNASMDVGITITWYDPRLKFLNLKPAIKNYFPCELIWTPRVRAVFGHGTGNVLDTNNYEKFCCAYANDETEERPLSDPFMGHHAEGLTHYVEVYLGVLAWVPCHFQLYTYPFDFQHCNLSFMVVNAPWSRVFDKLSPGHQVPYLNARRVLLEYVLEDVTTEVGSSLQGTDNNTYFVLTYHLQRLYGYHITNSFFPSLLMFVISYVTFFFELEDFTNRIMISLTAQLVLAALFTSTNQSSVKTPYLKLIDVWYAAIITFLFIIVISQTIVNVLLHQTTHKFDWVVKKVNSLVAGKSTKVEPLFIKTIKDIPDKMTLRSTSKISSDNKQTKTTITNHGSNQRDSDSPHQEYILSTTLNNLPEDQISPTKSTYTNDLHQNSSQGLESPVGKGTNVKNGKLPGHKVARYFNSISRIVIMSSAGAFVFFYSLLAAGIVRTPP